MKCRAFSAELPFSGPELSTERLKVGDETYISANSGESSASGFDIESVSSKFSWDMQQEFAKFFFGVNWNILQILHEFQGEHITT